MKREQWVCPECGRRLHVPHQEHVCGHYDLESHFAGKDPMARVVFHWLCRISDSMGAYDVLPMKTMIGFQARSNFAFIQTRKKGVILSLVMEAPSSHPTFWKVVPYGEKKGIYQFRIAAKDNLDDELESLLRNAFVTNA